ncbi:MAG: glycosyltransferase [Hungatella sp.]
MNPMVSVIVPVYNAQASIRRCVESVLNQGYTDFELLLVNDGSTDISGDICEEYARKDGRIRVIHKENTGVSDSRNRGLKEARGQFIQFLDSDDWITTDATTLMVRSALESGCDMVITDFYRVIGDRVSHKGDIEQDGPMTLELFAGFMMENPADFYYGVLWNKLFRRDIIETYQLSMDKAISWCEDFMFNLEYLRHTQTIYALRVPVYYYVKTKGSLVSQGISLTKTIKMKRMVFEYYHDFYKSVLTEEDYEKNRLSVYRFLVDAAGDGMIPISIFPGSRKLGEERSSVSHEALDEDGALMDAYRDRKLMEHYLDPVAIKYSLTLAELSLLTYLNLNPQINTLKELADITNMSRSRLALALQKLTMKELIKMEDQTKAILLPAAQPVLEDLGTVQKDYDTARYAGFSEEEMIQYAYFSNRIKENIQYVLKRK